MLATLQAQMVQAMFDRGNQAEALALFKGGAAQRQEGIALYRGNLTATWDKTLSAAYPVLRALVGDEFFAALARAYGQQNPSTDGDLHRYGAAFADFLAGFAPVASYRYFPDVAHYEWALHRAHFAPASLAIDRANLATCTPQQLEDMRLRLHPACTLLSSNWAVGPIWRAHQADPNGDAPPGLPQNIDIADCAVTVRPRWRVDLLTLSASSSAALHCIEQGACLGEAVDRALAIDAHFSFATELQQWIDHAVLCAASQ
jgi:hypothetical protein